MKKMDRVLVYFGGFILGMLLVSVIMSRRAAKEEAQVDPWLEHNQKMVDAGAESLPVEVPDSIRAGLVIDFGFLPNAEAPKEKVWSLTFEKSYPYVRVVQNLESGEFTYMAADQVVLELAEDVDATAVKPMLDKLGLRLRMFSRKENRVIIGVLHTGISAVPDTMVAVQPWAHLFKVVEPDFIRFKARQPGE
jgi:hypothetical protein